MKFEVIFFRVFFFLKKNIRNQYYLTHGSENISGKKYFKVRYLVNNTIYYNTVNFKMQKKIKSL